MENTKFSQKLQEIQKVLDFAIKNKYSDFYQNKYSSDIKNLDINSYADFQMIPFLEKNEILRVAWEKRNFLPESEIVYVGITSGTTDVNKPMTVPVSKKMLINRTADSQESTLSKSKVASYRLSRILCLIPGALNFYYAMIYFPSCDAIPIPGDFRDLMATARLSKELRANGIITIPTLLLNLVNELKKFDFNFSSVNWISLQGEVISQAKLDLIQSIFPNAKIEIFYGSNEMMNRGGYPCDQRKFEVNTYHPGSMFFFEILDDKDCPVKDGETGDLVVTDLDAEKPLPLIRYRTGDYASIKKIECKCGNNQLLTIGGRTGYDSLRIFGVTFDAQVLENAFGDYLKSINNYELHISEEQTGQEIKPKITLLISTNKEGGNLLPEIKEQIEKNYYVSKDKTLSFFTENKIFLPFEVKPLETKPVTGKSRHIVLDI